MTGNNMDNFTDDASPKAGVPTGSGAVEALLASCNAALDDCAALTDADVKLIARALKDRMSEGYLAALETENAQHLNAIECLRQERDTFAKRLQEEAAYSLTLIKETAWLRDLLRWCSMRLKHRAYQDQLAHDMSKGPHFKPADEPRVVRSKNPDDDFCPSDPRGPGRTGGDGTLQDTYRP